MNIIRKIKTMLAHQQFRRMKRRANRFHTITGKRYHVIPGPGLSFVVVSNTYVGAYNKTVPKAKRINIEQLLDMAFYSTPCKVDKNCKMPKLKK